MTSNQQIFCVIIGLLLALVVFFMINIAFNTPILPSLASEFIIFQDLYFENTML